MLQFNRLDLFEIASAKESIGQLSDASDYYWKAFKLDEKVDLKYRERFFKLYNVEESQKMFKAKERLKRVPPADPHIRPLELNRTELLKLLESYSECEYIPDNEDKPVMLAKLPYEVILRILDVLLVSDTPSWLNFSITCKKLVYVGFLENSIWSKLCQLAYERQNYVDNGEAKFKYLIKSQWDNNYYKMLSERPFLKYRGVYISKVTYMKEGARSENSNSWTLPYRMISYYRYYRFYADGTCLKIITILEPKKVIPKLHKGYKVTEDEELMKENLQFEAEIRENGTNKSPVDNFSGRSWLRIFSGTYAISLQGDVETNCDGPVEKYRFIDKFKIVNSGKYHRHNKLQWVDLGFYDTVNRTHSSLNRDNEKDFVFSRVKSYSY
ncbi:hypothetical protein CANINC_004432 [Pichia inconspicua]|uniref:F-box domain-containing protein n=1 Tax=Pichia inconspicua TaxID=52247 RepID=A0A4V4NF79_9ASCO|nr:hypothetical protein CANINC_004432 [[Candida] inconspicua]